VSLKTPQKVEGSGLRALPSSSPPRYLAGFQPAPKVYFMSDDQK